MSGRILIVDDERDMCEVLEARLGKRGFATRSATSAGEALDILRSSEIDVVVTDLNMREVSGIELCSRVAGSHPDVLVIVITAFGSLETAVAAIRAGAYDFLTKPFKIDELQIAIERALDHQSLRHEVKRLRRVVDDAQGFDDLIGTSGAMRRLYDALEQIVEADATVLITGESGTGKELAARALHRRGRRSSGPFVAINCAALPEPLLEAQLFGHARGAFTDAVGERTGLFVQANRGTLFLDEIGELPPRLQAKLLRALEERTVSPLGGRGEVRFDARIIAATNRDLEAAVEEGRFREDLYFRINVIRLELPPLRARSGDVLPLAQNFLNRFAGEMGKPVVGLTPPAAEKLVNYPWPGNVRELRNALERAVALTRYELLTVEDLPEAISEYKGSQHIVVHTDDPSEIVPLEQVERSYVQRVLEIAGGNKSLAARLLGVDRKTLYRKLQPPAMSGTPWTDEDED